MICVYSVTRYTSRDTRTNADPVRVDGTAMGHGERCGVCGCSLYTVCVVFLMAEKIAEHEARED